MPNTWVLTTSAVSPPPPLHRRPPPPLVSVPESSDAFSQRRRRRRPHVLLLPKGRALLLRPLRLRVEPELVGSRHGQHRRRVREVHQEGRRLLRHYRREPVHADRRTPLPSLLPLSAILGHPPPPDPPSLPRVRPTHRRRHLLRRRIRRFVAFGWLLIGEQRRGGHLRKLPAVQDEDRRLAALRRRRCSLLDLKSFQFLLHFFSSLFIDGQLACNNGFTYIFCCVRLSKTQKLY